MTQADSMIEFERRRMVELLSELTTAEGMRPSLLEGVKLMRADQCHPRTPVLYDPSIVIVASGRKKGFVGERCIVYDASNYLVLTVPLPFECQTEVADGEPLLGLSIRIDMAMLSELALKIDVRKKQMDADALSSICATPLDLEMTQAAVRLLRCLRSPVDAHVLGPSIVREITYRVLCGARGSALLALLARSSQMAQILATLQQIHLKFAEPLEVAGMAEESGMSISAFHHAFKAVTATSPLQYLKSIRLHKARMLMVHDGLGAAIAADRVGYESASQFSREFKRYFGHAPVEEADRLRSMLGVQAAAAVVNSFQPLVD
jgi:AraC-like DNA-binding protein